MARGGRVDTMQTLPAHVNYRPYTQAFGTCWSFAAAENLEGLNVRQGHALVNISEQEVVFAWA